VLTFAAENEPAVGGVRKEATELKNEVIQAMESGSQLR
jgi:hypothetical protein